MDIYSFTDYRLFLKKFYETLKQQNKRLSTRAFARMAGISSPSFFKMVIEGARNLTPNSIAKFAKALKLDARQTAYFEALVLFNQADSEKERDTYFQRLSQLRPKVKLSGLEKHQYDFFKKRHYVVIREMAALPGFKNDPEWIAKHLSPPIQPEEAKEAVEALVKLRLLSVNEKGNLYQTDPSITTHPEVDSYDLFLLYLDMISMAKQALVRVLPDMRDFSSLTIPLPKSRIDDVKRKILEFRQDLIDYVSKMEPDYHEVFQMNVQLFPVTHVHQK
jgi:uncharacterized protein (TIGR02147 family)